VDWTTIRLLNDGVGATRYELQGSVGSVGTVMYTLANNGGRDIRLVGGPDGSDFLHATLRWSVFDPTQGEKPADARPFPATIHPHQTFVLWFSLTQIDCTHTPRIDIRAIPLRWSALGHDHVYVLPLEIGGTNLPIVACAHPG
jgi:hypothetical protein